jgi:hypothetical protein
MYLVLLLLEGATKYIEIMEYIKMYLVTAGLIQMVQWQPYSTSVRAYFFVSTVH